MNLEKRYLKDVGERLKQVRRNFGITQAEFAVQLGLGNTVVSKYESGDVSMPMKVLRLIHERLNVSLHWLICGYGDMLVKAAHAGEVGRRSLERETAELLSNLTRDPQLLLAVLDASRRYENNAALPGVPAAGVEENAYRMVEADGVFAVPGKAGYAG